MSIKLENVQETVREIVKANLPFHGMTLPEGDTLDNHIFSEDGTIREAVEESLKSGWAVVVSPPILVTTISQVSAGTKSPDLHGSGKFEVLTVISLRTNPKANTGPLDNAKQRLPKVPVVKAVAQIAKGVLSWKPGNSDSAFTLLKERPSEPDFEDVGCFTYDIRVLTSVSL
jgi:hypothetical protein